MPSLSRSIKCLVFVVLLPVAVLFTAAAPCRGEGLQFGWEETVVPRAELSPDHQRELEAFTELKDWSVGFAYRRAYLFAGGFSFWHWKGRFVLYSGDNVMEPLPGQLAQILGPHKAQQLRVPLAYRLPAGLMTVLIGSVAIYLWFRFFPSKFGRVESLQRDARYVQAVDVYTSSLPKPEDEEVTTSHRRQALAVDYLAERSVPRARAEADLKLIISTHDEFRSKALRAEALAHEQAGEWDEALDLYEEAAELRELWDNEDYLYLRKCIARVEQKQANASE